MANTPIFNLYSPEPNDLVSAAPAQLKQMCDSIETALTSLTNQIGDITIGTIFPIGSVYISFANTNPTTLFGGTWERTMKGYTLVGVNENDPDFATANKTGGEKTHKLTISEIPSHAHTATRLGVGSGYLLNNGNAGAGQVGIRDGDVTATGGSLEHNNLQPYQTVYIWKRTA